MLVERSELLIKDGMEKEFAAAMRERGNPLLRDIPGVLSVEMGRGVENPYKFVLLVAWQSNGLARRLQDQPELRAVPRDPWPLCKGRRHGAFQHGLRNRGCSPQARPI